MHPKDFYDQTASVYDVRHESPPTRLVRKKEEALINRFASGTILDFGCGTGVHLEEGVIGLDISREMLKKARKRSPFLAQADENLPLKSNSIDTIFCFFTVFNMVDVQAVEKEFSRVLKPGGRILLSVASIHDHYGKTGKGFQVEGRKARLRLFEKGEIERIFGQFSLEHFSSLFSRVKPAWGSFREFSPLEKAKLAFESLSPAEKGGMYFMVFRKEKSE